MITLAEFVSKYDGAGLDYDKAYGDQCVDLVQFYAAELGLPHFWGNAADIANNYLAGWLHVTVPIPGDVVVYARNAANGYAGHVAIILEPPFLTFSQNYPTGTVCHKQRINETVIAYLRPTTLTGGNMITEEAHAKEVNDLRKQLVDAQVQVETLSHQLAQKNTEITDRIKQTTDAQVQVEKLQALIKASGAQSVTKDSVLNYINQNLK